MLIVTLEEKKNDQILFVYDFIQKQLSTEYTILRMLNDHYFDIGSVLQANKNPFKQQGNNISNAQNTLYTRNFRVRKFTIYGYFSLTHDIFKVFK